MPTLYNRIQGRSTDRMAALSDGIFACRSSPLDSNSFINEDRTCTRFAIT